MTYNAEQPFAYRKVSTFHTRLPVALLIANLSGEELAQRMNIPQEIISRLVQSDAWEPDPAFLLRVASALDVPAYWLAGYDIPVRLTTVSSGCSFCRSYDFAAIQTEINKCGRFSACDDQRPPEHQYRFCPECGRPLLPSPR